MGLSVMIKLRAFFILTLVLFSAMVSALCEEGQIDINSASLEELDQIVNIGSARAQEMITLRPFSSVDDMVRITGIAEKTLSQIKSQDLACVGDWETEENEENVNNETTIINEAEGDDIVIKNSSPKETKLQAINLNPQAIKSDVDSKVSDKRDYATYGLLAFVVLLGLLFLIRSMNIKRRNKHEFA